MYVRDSRNPRLRDMRKELDITNQTFHNGFSFGQVLCEQTFNIMNLFPSGIAYSV